MMRWTPSETTNFSEDANPAQDRPTSPALDAPAVRYLLDAVLDTFARAGTQSLVLVMIVALIVATLVFGVAVEETSAAVRWCPSCTGR